MLAIVKWLSISLLVLGALIHIFQPMGFYFWKRGSKCHVIKRIRLVCVVDNEEGNYFALERKVCIVCYAFHFVNILVREHNHKVLLEI